MIERTPLPSSAAPAMSRRGFFTLAAALGLSSCSSFWEGFFVRAYADEADTTTYLIYVAKRWEVPVCFLDMTDPANPKSVIGAKVTIASLYNGETATAVTDQLGVAIVDVTKLSEPELESDASVKTEYSFYGSLRAEAEGFRTYSTGKLRIRGGEQLEAPTRPLDGNPYIVQATINGWDILHAEKTTFVSTKSNPAEGHKAVIELGDCASGVDVSLFQNGGTAHSVPVSPSNGTAFAEISGQFFSTNAADADIAFATGTPIMLSLSSTGRNADVVATAADCTPGVSDEPISEEDPVAQGGLLSASSFLLGANDMSLPGIPSSFPVLGGKTFNFESMIPSFPLSLAYDPRGYIVAGVGYAGSLHRKGAAGGIWQHGTFQDARNEFQYSKDVWRHNFKKFREDREIARLLGDKTPKCGKLAPISGFEMNFQCGGMLHMEYSDYAVQQGSRDRFTGSAQLYAILSGEYSYTQPFMVLYVPLYVRFQISADLRATIDVGVGVTREGGDFHLADGSSFSLNLRPELAVTLGVGVADLLSVGIRGSGYLSGYMGVNSRSIDGKPNPRLSLEGGAEVAVVIQAFLFKGTVKLCEFDGTIYDNWAAQSAALLSADEGNTTSGLSDSLSAYSLGANGTDGAGVISGASPANGARLRSGKSAASAFSSNAIPVTNSELARSAEFIAAPKPVLMRSRSASNAEPQHDLYDYQPIQRRRWALRSSDSILGSLGKDGAAVTGGVVYEDAFSDPRMKIVAVNGVPWMFRILTVNYGSAESPVMRTRLSVAKWVSSAADGASRSDGRWDSAQVVDFATLYGNASGPSRDDLFDYDFSLLSASDVDGLGTSWKDGGVVRVFLTSGTRNASAISSDSTMADSVGSAMSHTVGAFLSIGEDGKVKTARCFLDTYKTSPASIKTRQSSFTHSSLVYPFIVHAFDESGGSVTGVFAFCRAAANANDLMDGPYEEHPATAFFDSYGNSLTGSLQFSYADGPQNKIEEYKAILSDVKSSVSVGILRSNVEGGNQIAIGCAYITRPSESAPPALKSFALLRNANMAAEQNDPGQILPFGVCEDNGINTMSPSFVYPWPAHGPGGALCATNKSLFACAFSFDEGASAAPTGLVATPISLDNDISLSSFTLDPYSGMLYYSTARVGTERGHEDSGDIKEASSQVSDYRIWATRCITVGGETGFMKPFSLLQTDQPIDTLEYLDLGDAYGFMANSIQSMQDSVSRIVLYKLPYLKRVTLLDFESVNRYVCAGEEEAFRITVRNDGNVSISSFSVAMVIGETEYQLDFDLTQTDKIIPLASVADAAAAGAGGSGGNAGAEREGAGSASSREAGGTGSATSDSVVTGVAYDLATNTGILNPGLVRSYEFLWRIPEDLKGETPLSLTVLENDAAPEGSQSLHGISKGEAERFTDGAVFASSSGVGVEASSITSSALFRKPEAQAAGDGGNPDDPGNPDEPGDSSEGGGGAGGLDGDASNAGGSAEGGSAVPGGPGGIPNTGDDLSATTAAVLLAGLGLAGAGVAAKKMKD